jgi:hypothetical protein
MRERTLRRIPLRTTPAVASLNGMTCPSNGEDMTNALVRHDAPTRHRSARTAAAAGALLLAAGCAMTGPGDGESRPERVIAITSGNQLIEFVSGRPESIIARRPLTGIQNGERIVGMDFRPADGRLFAVGDGGQLYVINLSTGIAEGVGKGGFRSFAAGDLGIDFNPTVDRIRLVNTRGGNLRIHPDTGAVVDADDRSDGLQVDGELGYAKSDVNSGRTPRVTGAAYTNSHAGAISTTNYAIDSAQGTLVTQGSGEGAATAVSPNTGQLFTVGSLGVDLAQGPVGFDIGPGNIALMTATIPGGRSELYRVNLMNGTAGRIGRIGIGEAVTAMAIVPLAGQPTRR